MRQHCKVTGSRLNLISIPVHIIASDCPVVISREQCTGRKGGCCVLYHTRVCHVQDIIENNGNQDDIVAFMQDRLLPVEEIQASQIAAEILANPPNIGYLTISNALQWRLQYRRVIEEAGKVDGIRRLS